MVNSALLGMTRPVWPRNGWSGYRPSRPELKCIGASASSVSTSPLRFPFTLNLITIIIIGMLKLTEQRQAILGLINASNQHWNADEVARALSDTGHPIGVATVYRGLAALEAAGLLGSIQMADKKRYERVGKGHHDHMICTKCGRIEEFTHEKIEQLQESIAAERGFVVSGHQLTMFGHCKLCSQEKI